MSHGVVGQILTDTSLFLSSEASDHCLSANQRVGGQPPQRPPERIPVFAEFVCSRIPSRRSAVGSQARNCQSRVGWRRATVLAERAANPASPESSSQEHGQDRRIGIADRIDADATHHRRDRSVGLGLHPRGPVFETQVWKSRQQDAARGGTGAFG
jgi:hypothetical protein